MVDSSSQLDARRQQLLAFVEIFGLQIELTGWPRIAGKILGWLLVSPVAEQSPEQLVETLRISKASVSTMTRFLIDRGFIERGAKPGDRKIYFRVAPGLWPQLLRDRLGTVAPIQRLAEQAVELTSEGGAEASARAREMAAFFRWWGTEVPGLSQRWEAYRSTLKDENS